MKQILALLFSIQLAGLAYASEPQHNEPEKVFLAYVDATRTKDLAALDRFIADDYLAINGQNKLATKAFELEEAKEAPVFNEMQVEEIHSLVVKNTAVITGIIGAAFTNSAGKPVQVRVRVLGTLLKRHGKWQIVADESAPAHA